MSKVKITVVKKLNGKDMFGDKLPAQPSDPYVPECPRLEEGQEFVTDFVCPPGFCGVAFADMQKEIEHLIFGGSYPWFKDKGVTLSCCNDGLRPVIFKLERVED
jgi:uncharacterized repeat protein (TIGR04076 family)